MRLIELHILQSFPVTCLNRDDVGSPKSALFGGVSRARVSSQCWKRAIRLLAEETDSEAFAGQRSCLILDPLKKSFAEKGLPERAADLLTNAVAEAFGKIDAKKPNKVSTLLYFSPSQLDAVVSATLEAVTKAGIDLTKEDSKKEEDKKAKELAACASKAAKALSGATMDAADIAIFGRMVANDSSLTLEGAGMFSHALSTHQVANEVDFFSAVDDLKPDDTSDAGAGHIGTLEFNSACYYRYIGVNWDLLSDADHLGHFSEEQRKKVVAAFLEAAILAVPNARRNSMFGNNPPDHVLGLVRTGQPLSLVNAFENPVRPKNGYVDPSNVAMTNHFEKLKTTYGGLGINVEVRLPEKNLQAFIDGLLASKELNDA
jgi:CRISPR system Cascade subunit CasC